MNNLILIFTQKKYFAVAQLFIVLSLIFGTWVIYIPGITQKLQLSEGKLGIVLLFGAFGALVALPLGKVVVLWIGEGKLAMFSIIAYAFMVLGNFIAGSYAQICFFLFLNGFTASFLQIAINSIVSTIEKEESVSIMVSYHGFYSLGGVLSAGLGTVLLIAFDNALLHMATMVLVVILLQTIFYKKYKCYSREKNQQFKTNHISIKKIKSPALLFLSLVGMCIMVTEGAIADWSALYLRDVALTKSELVGLGYAGFSITMTMGRFTGDYLSKRFGAWQFILTGYLLSALGILIVLSANTILSIVGFAIVGIGAASIVPEVYRLSTNIKGIDPSTGIAFMAGAGFFGFLAGPLLLGIIIILPIFQTTT